LTIITVSQVFTFQEAVKAHSGQKSLAFVKYLPEKAFFSFLEGQAVVTNELCIFSKFAGKRP